ncbi:MAG: type II toxin-antitoxin system VapC family toxin [Pseudomonadota bacterium]|nr:type II toxin-antitoxin system VapC family toxin [Pseudomonadota bacterium]MDP1906638.1 type II toxin-antitoxin system VapC family toxin [Pseudomonadota bacterium]MDP2354057.1 type II toxin-antitoxin system VapC family toxin [Pseudomonadota bacterium]
MADFVLDASAILAYLQQEPGADRVESLLLDQRCLLLTVNLTEVLTRLADWNVPLAEAERHLVAMDLAIVPFDQTLARLAAELRPATRALGLSLGDRACLALAKARNVAAVTADRAWLQLDPGLGISVESIRGDAT